MAIRFQCASCSQPIEVDDEWASKTVACPYCRKTIAAPAESTLPDVSGIPLASPLSTRGFAATIDDPALGPAGAIRNANRAAVIALILAALQILSLAAMEWVTAANRMEAEEFIKAVSGKSSFAQMIDAQNEFFRARGGIPSWLATVVLLEVFTGVAWLTTVIVGIIAVRRPTRRGMATLALVLSALVPLFVCVGGVQVMPGQ